jgi:PQQ-dependent dehydrogenase (methanol/ethanol family)
MHRLLFIAISTSLLLATAVGASAERSGGSAAAVPPPAFSTPVLLRAPGADWITNQGNLFGTNASSLTQITPANVSNLKAAWHTELQAQSLAVTLPLLVGGSTARPLAYRGILYTEDSADKVYATDAATGKTLWVYDAKINSPFQQISVRGVGIGDGKVFLADALAQITAIDANTGQKLWVTKIAKPELGFQFTAAPLYYDGMILTGTSGGDLGASSFFVALNAKTGKVLWHWNAIPTKPAHTGYDTWVPPKQRAWVGGGAIWTTPTVDPKLGLVYFGVGNPIPYVLGRPPGKEIPINSIVALHIKTGKTAWYYQTIHHDLWDWDQSQGLQLFDMTYNGKRRQAGITIQKSGYAFVLDRTTGKPILPVKEVSVPQLKKANTWPTQPIPQGGAGNLIQHTVDPAPWAGIAMPDGNPATIATNTQYPPLDDTHFTVHVQPGLNQWQHNSYDPKTGNYFLQISSAIVLRKALPAAEVLPGIKYNNANSISGRISGATAGTPAATASRMRLVAFNPAQNKIVWITEYEANATTAGYLGAFTGTALTASGVLFAGRANGYLEAYDSSNGKLLWTSPQLVAGTRASPVVFSVNGKETVAIYAAQATNVKGQTGLGSELYAFQLP